MIEPTDEMRAAFEAAYAAAEPTDGLYFKEDAVIQFDAGLAAVLAIVERDYAIGRLSDCDAPGPDGVRCVRKPHDDSEYHGWVGDGRLVRW